ncbi:MAG: hypothetical protein GON13_02845 [Nanoarchaeota archaeon]|nr:hypothetical protein [Nanoarchaeota archaeon]
MIGKIFLIVGNSGSGKDSLIRELIVHPSVCTVKRYITRPKHDSEDFISVSENVFKKLLDQNVFFLNWTSYGFNYGVPREAVALAEKGFIVLINVSRQVVNKVKKVNVIEIKASEKIVKERIISRKREDEKGLLERLVRVSEMQNFSGADFVVDNSKNLDCAVKALKTIIFSKK